MGKTLQISMFCGFRFFSTEKGIVFSVIFIFFIFFFWYWTKSIVILKLSCISWFSLKFETSVGAASEICFLKLLHFLICRVCFCGIYKKIYIENSLRLFFLYPLFLLHLLYKFRTVKTSPILQFRQWIAWTNFARAFFLPKKCRVLYK